MYIKIGTLARHFRISPQTIRYYEEKGFLSPRRNGDNGDRRYHVRTLKLLSSIRQYHNMGFGTRQIQEVFGETDLSGIDAHLKAQMEKTEREMLVLAFRQEAIARRRDDIRRIHRLLDVCELAPLPPMYLLIDRRDGQIIEDDAVWSTLDRWVDALPIVEGAVRVDVGAMLACDVDRGRESGYCAWEEDAASLGLPVDPPVEQVEYPLCIHTVIKRAEGEPFYEGIVEYAASNGLAICGPTIQRVLAKVGEGRASGETVIPGAVYYECWVPVRRETSAI